MGDKGKGRSSGRGRPKKAKRTPRETVHVRVPVPAGPPWDVRWHPDARKEKEAVKEDGNTGDYKAINTVAEKLKVHGPALPFPHQSDVKGKGGKGLRELRPTQGRSPWRGIYRRFENTYVVLAVGPEAELDQSGFDAAVKAAHRGGRASKMRPKAKASRSDNTFAMVEFVVFR